MICRACGEENPERARFCLACGAPLDAVTVSAREERKVVTVLFCDLVGFTARSERMDVEDVRGTLQPYHRLLRRELESFGGTVEKFIGDAVMALFGAPVAHEDDAERAVRAALAIVEAVAALREDDPRLDLHVRVGLNTGEALVALGADLTRGEGMASGDVVNTAARLQAAAPVDGILVGGPTREATSRAIRYRPANSVSAKGKADPVPSWLVERARALIADDEADVTLSLVGRSQERGLLLGALERTRSEASAQLVTLVGPPGIGKSRLIAELSRQIDSEPELTTWRRGRSLAYGEGVAFWALGEIVKAEAGILESDLADVAGEKLAQAVNALLVDGDAAWVEGLLRPLVGLDSDAAPTDENGRVQAFAAWRRFCEAIAEERPAVFVFEDLHWADDALLDFVDHLADRAVGVPLLLVCTARPELLARRPAWGGGKPNALTVSLSPLSDADTARLIGDLLDQALLPADLQAALLARAEGNPLYAMEYVRMLRDSGALERAGSGWRYVPGVRNGELPSSVHAIIAARLDALGDTEKRLLQDAAVMGRTAWVGAAAHVGELPAAEADDLVHQLGRKQLIRRVRHSSVAGDSEFSFTHALTQEVAYGQIPRPRRAQKHLRVAEWIERLAGGRDDKAELLAHHYHSALDLQRELGASSGDTGPRAQRAFVEAGHQAAAAYAYAAAAQHLAAALELTEPDDPARPELLLERATALWRSGQADEAVLLEARDGQVDVAGEAWAEYLLAHWCLKVAGDGDRADAHLDRAAELGRRVSFSVTIGEIECLRAFRAYTSGRVSDCGTIAAEAIDRAELEGLAEVRGALLQWRGAVRLETGDVGGLAEMEAAARTLADHVNPGVTHAYANLAEGVRGIGDLARAADLYADSLRWATRFGEPTLITLLEIELANLAHHAGRWDDALAAVEPLTDTIIPLDQLLARIVHGWIRLARGDSATAIEAANASIAYTSSSGDSEVLFYGLALRAAANVVVGDAGAARADCDAFLREWTRVRGMLGRLENLAEIAPILVAHERHTELERAARLIKPPSRWVDALLALAERRYEDAAAIYTEMGTLPNTAATHTLAAAAAADRGRLSDARRQLALAADIHRSLGATADLRDPKVAAG